ncbi:nucleolar protein 12 [Aplochiton taeniatus]
MKNLKNLHKKAKNDKFKPGSKKRENKCIVVFDDKERENFLTGFHKRKVERRKAAVVEIETRIKEEQKRVREERQKEYLRMLQERKEAMEESDDELKDVITNTTEAVQYDHPNHTVTVTTISDIDLTADFLGPASAMVHEEKEGDEGKEEVVGKTAAPKKSNHPILNKKISALTASLHAHTKQRNRKGKPEGRGGRGRPTEKTPVSMDRKNRLGRTTKKQRRKRTGKRVHLQD